MTALHEQLREQIEDWVGGIVLMDTEEVSGVIAETNGIYDEQYCDGVDLEATSDTAFEFICHIAMSGEPRKDDVPFAGEKIQVQVRGEISLDLESGEWEIGEEYEIGAGVHYPDDDYDDYERYNARKPGLRRISLENFKGIGPRVDIELKPVTLLFGPNSVGKSTILHAIHCAHSILETSNPDVGRTLLGGDIDLGGFENYVHDHDLDAPVIFGFEFEADEEDLPVQFQDGRFKTIRVEFVVRYSHFMKRPIVEKYKVDYNGSVFGEFTTSLDSGETRATQLTYSHEVLPSELDFQAWDVEGEAKPEGLIEPTIDSSTAPAALKFPPGATKEQIEAWVEWNTANNPLHSCLPGRKMALPWWDRPVDIDPVNTSGLEDEELDEYFEHIGILMQAAGVALRRQLERFRYVGPVRQAPPRNYLSPTSLDESRWASGLGAWDMLVRDGVLRAEVSAWLSDENRLNTGCAVEWNDTRELDEPTYRRLQQLAEKFELDENFRLLTSDLPRGGRLAVVDVEKQLAMAPCDLGEGISQVVPVVTAALARTVTTPSNREERVDLVAIEQPELHIHPRMQVVLGDLFLSQCHERQFLIETHSEHLMLRLLRRIRETNEGELPGGAPEVTTDTVSVIYVEQVEGAVVLKNLRIDPDGDFHDRWPGGFFGERAEELF